MCKLEVFGAGQAQGGSQGSWEDCTEAGAAPKGRGAPGRIRMGSEAALHSLDLYFLLPLVIH